MRANPIAFGIGHGCSGAPARLSGGGAPGLALPLAFARLDAALPDGQAQRAAEQLGVGELLAGACVAVVVERLKPARAQVAVELVGEDLDARADGPDEAGVRAEQLMDLLGVRRPRLGCEVVAQLDLVEAVVS